ncbi:hypothetical protein ANN_25729 [Periplaneta americana]|uniref:RNA-directed DNA polymerase from mobile element jockey n=1 Tax=Periplaneta americana TaxID=6978 RepID=A0ABQ8S4D2_PERAM|nr:hypothetical protein ANN_25729 [Periplaneta americana]
MPTVQPNGEGNGDYGEGSGDVDGDNINGDVDSNGDNGCHGDVNCDNSSDGNCDNGNNANDEDGNGDNGDGDNDNGRGDNGDIITVIMTEVVMVIMVMVVIMEVIMVMVVITVMVRGDNGDNGDDGSGNGDGGDNGDNGMVMVIMVMVITVMVMVVIMVIMTEVMMVMVVIMVIMTEVVMVMVVIMVMMTEVIMVIIMEVRMMRCDNGDNGEDGNDDNGYGDNSYNDDGYRDDCYGRDGNGNKGDNGSDNAYNGNSNGDNGDSGNGNSDNGYNGDDNGDGYRYGGYDGGVVTTMKVNSSIDDNVDSEKAFGRVRKCPLTGYIKQELSKWFSDWRLLLNIIKTEAKIFSLRPIHNPPPLVLLNEQVTWLSSQEVVKYLGILLDTKLTRNAHITRIVTLTSSRIRKLYPLVNRRSQIGLDCSMLLYTSLVRPLLTYAAPVWGTANKTHMHRLQVLQNKFLRTATNAPWFVRNQQLHQELGILPLEQYIHSMSKSFFNKLPGVPGAVTYNIGARSCQPSRLKRKLPQDILLSDTVDSS